MGRDGPAAPLAMRLARDAAAWLPTEDPDACRAIIGWLGLIAGTGVDPVAALREALPRWFGAAARDLLAGAFPAGSKTAGGIAPTPETVALEPLPPVRRPTLWPQRPKRFPDELFSSWLWRAAIAAGAPPDRFARDALGACHGDPDIDVSDAALHRLALASGQPVAHLAAGTLGISDDRVPISRAETVQDTLLRHGRLLLARPSRSGRPRTVLQYCPRCLAEGPEPYFRRGWRFAVEAVCVRHGCRLHDACWRCGALLAPLAQTPLAQTPLARTNVSRQPICAACRAVLAEAATKPAPDAARRQRGLLCVLYYAAACLEPAALRDHLVVLSARFPPGSGVAKRERTLAGLLPANLDRWFGPVDDPRQRDLLQRHAHGGAYGAWFGAAATRPASDAADLLPLGRIRPLSRGKLSRSPWFAARPARAALRADDGRRRRPPA
ncbi:MAG TPA: TniQ family protein [Acetobacteraceae bacterium]|nr:TniQ family protein [Acetobacteraceae bacterium]